MIHQGKKSKALAVLFVAALLAMLWPGAVFAAAPTITNAVMDEKNNYITVTFSEGVHGDALHTTGINKDNFDLAFAQNSGVVSGASIKSVDVVETAPSPNGGATKVKINLNLVDGPPAGVETITIRPKADSIYNYDGVAVLNTESTGALTLNKLPAPSFAEGYPKLGTTQAAGSKRVDVLAKADHVETVVLITRVK